METYENRNAVPEKYKWNLTDFFENEADFQKCYQKTEKEISDLENYKGCTKDPQKLYDFLELELQVCIDFENLFNYSYLINDQELGISKNIERKNKVTQLQMKLDNYTNFFHPELLKLSKTEYENLFIQEKKLEKYRKELDKIYREKEYILSEDNEYILSNLTSVMNHYEEIASNLQNNEIDYGTMKIHGKEEQIAVNNYRKFMKEKNSDIRKNVYASFWGKLKQHRETFASLLNSYIGMESTCAKLRNYKSAWEKKLFLENFTNNMFEALVNVTEKNVDILQKYYCLRKEVLNLDILHRYDMSLELSNTSTEYTIEEAQNIIKDALNPLGEKYLDKFEKIIKNRDIDYCQYKGKCSGGYCMFSMTQDARILMSYLGDFTSISTMIHESGHHIHAQILKENNPEHYRNCSLYIAEVPSLLNECLLSSYMAEHGKTKEDKLKGIENILGVIVSNLFGAVREGNMERKMYEEIEQGGSLTSEFLENLSYNSLQKYYGNTVHLDEESRYEWIMRSHYYCNFYLYSYAICICVASSLAFDILNKKEGTLEKYYQFLQAGSDQSPLEIFAILGVNLEEDEVYENAIRYFDSLIEKYKEILNRKEG